jgi:hypothetical protein
VSSLDLADQALVTHQLPQARADYPFRLNGATNAVVTSNGLTILGIYMNTQFAWIATL